MLVCHCQVVCDRTIRECVVDGARTEQEVRRACGAGAGCGGCRPLIDRLIEEHGETTPISRLPIAS